METIHPRGSSIPCWNKKFMKTGSVLDAAEVGDQEYHQKIPHPQNSFAACYLQTLFVLVCHLAEVFVTFSFRRHAIVIFFAEPCALL